MTNEAKQQRIVELQAEIKERLGPTEPELKQAFGPLDDAEILEDLLPEIEQTRDC